LAFTDFAVENIDRERVENFSLDHDAEKRSHDPGIRLRDAEKPFSRAEMPSGDAEKPLRRAERQSGKAEIAFHEGRGRFDSTVVPDILACLMRSRVTVATN
jgi:hypothetical protein